MPDAHADTDTTAETTSEIAPRVDPVDLNANRVPDWLETGAAWTWRLLILLAAFLAIVWLLARVLVVSIPIVVALIASTLAVPPARWLESRGMRPAGAATVVVIGGLSVIVGLLAVLTPAFIDQIGELGPTLESAWDDVLQWLEDGPLGYDRQQVEDLITTARQNLSSGNGSGLLTGVVAGVSVAAQMLGALALFLVLLFFFVKDGEDIIAWVLARTPARHRPMAEAIGDRAWQALGGYVRGTALIALIDALGIMIGLWILDVPLVAPLTLLVFLGGFLPVIGAFLAGLVAVLVALAAGGVTKALIVLAMIVAVQQLEGNLLQPTIMRRAVSLHPVVILVALAGGAALAGILGAFLAVPVAAVVAAIGNELRLRAEADPVPSP